jgi:hypothetical protein
LPGSVWTIDWPWMWSRLFFVRYLVAMCQSYFIIFFATNERMEEESRSWGNDQFFESTNGQRAIFGINLTKKWLAAIQQPDLGFDNSNHMAQTLYSQMLILSVGLNFFLLDDWGVFWKRDSRPI